MKRVHPVFITAVVALLLASCSKKNEEDVRADFYGNTPPGCDTANMSFVTNIKPILQNACYACHSNTTFSISGTKLEDYADLHKHVAHGDILGTITHAAGYPTMPQNAPKLSDCDINKIKAWIDRGALNN